MSHATLKQRITQRIANGVANWSRRRHGVDTAPVVLTNRRIYILPTKLGLIYAVIVVAMGIGGMNYANNLALLLTFLLAAIGFVAMHHAHRNLAGLRIANLATEPVFAGQAAPLQLAIDNPSLQTRLSLCPECTAAYAEQVAPAVNIAAMSRTTAVLPIVATRRGWLNIERYTISSRYPFGLFRAWSVLHLPLTCLVYPKPSARTGTPPFAQFDTHRNQDARRGDDEFSGLRSYQVGDSLKQVDWKAYAREQGLLVKQYAGAAISSCILDWDTLSGLDPETRLSQLCRWVLDAHQQGIAYGLKLPGFLAEPALNDAHRNRCLMALALFGASTT